MRSQGSGGYFRSAATSTVHRDNAQRHDASSLLPSPTQSFRSSVGSYGHLARSHSFNPRSSSVRGAARRGDNPSVVYSDAWLSGNVSRASSGHSLMRGSDDEYDDRFTHHATRRVPRERSAPSQTRAASASAKESVFCCRNMGCAEKSSVAAQPRMPAPQRSRSAPPTNPLVQAYRGPPLPQPRFRYAGPGPKIIRNPAARTITFRPVHWTLGFEPQRDALWVYSPPWQELAYRDQTNRHRSSSGQPRNAVSDADSGADEGCCLFACCR